MRPGILGRLPLFRLFLCAVIATMAGTGMVQRACAQVPGPLVLHIGWDGADHRRVSQMLSAGELPNLAALVQHGNFQQLQIVSITSTRPSWTEQLALPASVFSTLTNDKFRPIRRGWTVFEVLNAAGIPSAFVSGKCPGMLCQQNKTRSLAGTPFEHVPDATVYFAQNSKWSKQEVTSRCLDAVGAVQNTGYVFCHYQWPDKTGHPKGGDSEEYSQDLRDLDAELGILRSSLPPNSVVILTSDHGFEKAGDPGQVQFFSDKRYAKRPNPTFGHHHFREPNAILAASVPLLGPATGRDIAKTIYALLGVAPPEPLPEGRSLLP